MLDNATVRKIEDFVYSKPRSVQEIAEHLKRNWRTADRYVDEIISEYGTLAKRTFREGTRGALKIIYWAAVEKISNSVFQENLEKEILGGREKGDFSSFDIFQHVEDKNKVAIVEKKIDEKSTNLIELKNLLKGAKKQVILFSGNLSFVNLSFKGVDLMEIFEELVNRNVSIKVISRVDLIGRKNVEKLLSLNFKHGKEMVEIRHRNQPLRAVVVDNKVLRLKEVNEPTGKINELDKKIFIFYTIKDREWVEWITRVFWKMFSSSVGWKKRFDEIEKLQT